VVVVAVAVVTVRGVMTAAASIGGESFNPSQARVLLRTLPLAAPFPMSSSGGAAVLPRRCTTFASPAAASDAA
jgi:hypothetical protein